MLPKPQCPEQAIYLSDIVSGFARQACSSTLVGSNQERPRRPSMPPLPWRPLTPTIDALAAGRVACLLGLLALPGLVPCLAAPPAPAAQNGAVTPSAHVPLCEGLHIVTSISQKDGDYESIKTIERLDPKGLRLKYSSERMTQDIFSTDPPKLEQLTVYRQVLAADQSNAKGYLQTFAQVLPEQIPGTTSIGTSTAVLKALNTGSTVEFGYFEVVDAGGPLPAERGTHPNVYDYQVMGKIRRLEPAPVMLPVIVNDVPTTLPAVHAGGTFFSDKSEFWFLDDPANPLTLKFRLGIDAVTPPPDYSDSAPAGPPAKRDRDDLQVTKISYRCSDAPAVNSIEQQLSATGKAEIYDIYFSFNSDQIRDESEPSLKAIADALLHHPEWKLAVNGHTDNVGGDAYNLSLSKRRADAVRTSLASRYHIDPARLNSNGFGASQPQDTNATLEGRAHNRRVELIRR
jgi:outer membrane protein OmpA-like peptidoglycan-associated protein